MMTTPKLVIFTDLDGTLLNRDTYSFEPAKPALDLIKKKGVSLVLSSSKTRAEIELYRKKMENAHPFISENGGAVFVPKDYFSFSFPYDLELEEYLIIELGHAYPQLVEILNSIKKETGIQIRGFSDLSEEELVSLCGLSRDEARFAKKREYDEPFMVEGGEREVEIVKRKIQMRGVNYAWGGRFHHILGKNDKGKAVEMLKELYENEFFSITTIGIGDSLNDLPMLRVVDRPIFLNKEDGAAPEIFLRVQGLSVIKGAGPKFWNQAILNIIKEVCPCSSSTG